MNYFIKPLLFLVVFFVLGCEQKEYVKDFKVEGIAVGDSLLTYFSEEDILETQRKTDIMGNPIDLEGRIYIDSVFDKYQFETYQSLQMYYRLDDEKYIIHGVGGGIFYGYDADKCNNKYFEVKKILEEQYTTPEITEYKDEKDGREGMGDTTINETSYDFEDGSLIRIECNNFDNELLEIADYFMLTIFSKEANSYFNLLNGLVENSE